MESIPLTQLYAGNESFYLDGRWRPCVVVRLRNWGGSSGEFCVRNYTKRITKPVGIPSTLSSRLAKNAPTKRRLSMGCRRRRAHLARAERARARRRPLWPALPPSVPHKVVFVEREIVRERNSRASSDADKGYLQCGSDVMPPICPKKVDLTFGL